jgi:hypothetical protein
MAGTIYGGVDLNGIVLADPATQRPATVTGSVSNQNGDAVYGQPVARWTVANSGTIQSTGTTGYGIDLGARGTVENGESGATAALIAGYGGVLIRGALATVGNLGTIEGTGKGRDGVELKAGGRSGRQRQHRRDRGADQRRPARRRDPQRRRNGPQFRDIDQHGHLQHRRSLRRGQRQQRQQCLGEGADQRQRQRQRCRCQRRHRHGDQFRHDRWRRGVALRAGGRVTSSGTPALVSHFTAAPSLAAAQLFFIA